MPLDPNTLLIAIKNMLRQGLDFQFGRPRNTTPGNQPTDTLVINSNFEVDVLLKNLGVCTYRNIIGSIMEGSAVKTTAQHIPFNIVELKVGQQVRIGTFHGQVKSDLDLLLPAVDQLVIARVTKAFGDLSEFAFSDEEQLTYRVGQGPVLHWLVQKGEIPSVHVRTEIPPVAVKKTA